MKELDFDALMRLVDLKLTNPKKYEETMKAMREVAKDMIQIVTAMVTEMKNLAEELA